MSLSNNMDDWTEEKCITFMREYRKRPILWNQNYNAFYKQKSKPAAWGEIAEAVGMTKFCCRHKLGILMSSFRREKAKIVNSRKKGDPSKYYYYSHWFCFKYMAFLLDKKAEIKRQARIEQGLEDDSDEPNDVEIRRMLDNYIENFDEDDNTADSYDLLEAPTTLSPESPRRRHSVSDKGRENRIITIKRKTNIDTPSPETKKRSHLVIDKNREPRRKKICNDTPISSLNLTSARSPSPSSDCEEDITHFSKYVAAKMKKYSEITKNAVQQAICEIIFKADTDRENFHFNLTEERQFFEIDNNVAQPLDIKISYSDSE